MNNKERLDKLNIKYDKLQKLYGDKSLTAIYNGGCINTPNICFVFMNPTGKNIAANKSWTGLKAPWISTKPIWKLFNKTKFISNDIYEEIMNKKPMDWDYDFSSLVYSNIELSKAFITNLGKCTQVDARPLKSSLYREYLPLLEQEIDIIRPKVIVTLGNQVSSIVLDKKISVSKCRKEYYLRNINGINYKVYPIYYPVGNNICNLDKSIEDINYIIDKELKE